MLRKCGITPGAQGGASTQNQQAQIDYSKIEEIVNKRSSQSMDSALKGYLKQQGLSGDELTQAVNSYKQQKAETEQKKIQEAENMKLENEKLKAQILNTNIENKLASLAASEGVSADKIPFLAKLINRDGLTNEKGEILDDKIKESMNEVIKAFPDFKGNSQNNNGFQQIGGGGSNRGRNSVDEQLDAIFGVKKK
jgi:hypothetical protein